MNSSIINFGVDSFYYRKNWVCAHSCLKYNCTRTCIFVNQLFIKSLLFICLQKLFNGNCSCSYQGFVIIQGNFTLRNGFTDVKSNNLIKPSGRMFFCISIFLSFELFLSYNDMNPTIHGSKCASLPSNSGCLESKTYSFSSFLYKLSNKIDKACWLAIKIKKTPKCLLCLFHVDNRIQINDSKPYFLISSNLIFIHHHHLQISTIIFETAVNVEGKCFIKHGVLVSFRYSLCRVLLIRQLYLDIWVHFKDTGLMGHLSRSNSQVQSPCYSIHFHQIRTSFFR